MSIQWFKKIALATLLLAGFSAQAAVITDIEGVNKKVDFVDSTTWTHDLSDTEFLFGSAQSATLSIEFWDDGGFLDLGEVATIIVGIIDFQDGQFIYNPINTWIGELGFSSLAGLNAFGLLDVTIFNVGDFYIGNSILEVTTADSASVPESSSLALLALGLMGLVVLRRKNAV